MPNRRRLLGLAAAIAAAPALAGRAAAATTPAEDGQGAPAATSPFAPEVYRERRLTLMKLMKSGIAVIHGATEIDASNPSARQDSDFAYLTGIQDEAGAVLVLAPSERTVREFLLLAPRNPEVERWDGVRLPLGQSVRARTGFDTVMRTSALPRLVTGLASRSGELHYLGAIATLTAPVPPVLELYGKIASRVPGTRVVNSHNLLRGMRVVKEPRELALIQSAIAATERGLLAAMRQARAGMREHQLKDIIEAEFRAAGARSLAFPSIVGTGRSSAVLHYTGSAQVIRAGDLVLCDVGAEVGGYAADITRTFPVNGTFSAEQRAVYEKVLEAQEAGMRALKAGVFYEDISRVARDLLEAAGHRDDFWHGLGHFVGLEVHDVGDYAAALPVDSVITIEPGIYLPDRGFGVRIEDDYRVTRGGYDHLTRAVPRAPAEIEALLAQR